jgi:hypothetical protein
VFVKDAVDLVLGSDRGTVGENRDAAADRFSPQQLPADLEHRRNLIGQKAGPDWLGTESLDAFGETFA